MNKIKVQDNIRENSHKKVNSEEERFLAPHFHLFSHHSRLINYTNYVCCNNYALIAGILSRHDVGYITNAVNSMSSSSSLPLLKRKQLKVPKLVLMYVSNLFQD